MFQFNANKKLTERKQNVYVYNIWKDKFLFSRLYFLAFLVLELIWLVDCQKNYHLGNFLSINAKSSLAVAYMWILAGCSFVKHLQQMWQKPLFEYITLFLTLNFLWFCMSHWQSDHFEDKVRQIAGYFLRERFDFLFQTALSLSQCPEL